MSQIYSFCDSFPPYVFAVSHWIVSHFLWPHGWQHAKLPCPQNLLKLMSMSWWCYPDIFSSVTLFSSCSQYSPASEPFPHYVAKILELQLQHQSFQWIFRTYSFRIDWFDLLSVQGTLKSLFQHHSSKASILWRSTFFMVQLSHSYMTTGKIIALVIWTLIGKVMSLLFNMLSRFVIGFLPRSKLFFNFIAVVTLWSNFGAHENKICKYSTIPPL